MNRRIVMLAAAVVALGALAPAAPAWSSPWVGYVYHCSNGRVVKLGVEGNTSITPTPRIRLFAVRFKVHNTFGNVTLNAATFEVSDPVGESYVNNAGTGAVPGGWSGAHSASGLDANFTGATAVPQGGSFYNAFLHGRYTDSNPGSGNVIAFMPGTITLTLAPSTTVTCTPPANLPPFATATE